MDGNSSAEISLVGGTLPLVSILYRASCTRAENTGYGSHGPNVRARIDMFVRVKSMEDGGPGDASRANAIVSAGDSFEHYSTILAFDLNKNFLNISWQAFSAFLLFFYRTDRACFIIFKKSRVLGF